MEGLIFVKIPQAQMRQSDSETQVHSQPTKLYQVKSVLKNSKKIQLDHHSHKMSKTYFLWLKNENNSQLLNRQGVLMSEAQRADNGAARVSVGGGALGEVAAPSPPAKGFGVGQ